jgi:ferric-dicitrate binding protein FerR (iron transport regulator)
MNKKRIWEEIAAGLNQEEFDKEIAAQEETELSQLREIHSLLKKEKKVIDLLLKTDTSKAWEQLKSKKINTAVLIRNILAYAACAVLLIASGYLLHSRLDIKPEEKESWTVFTIPNAEMGNVILADGTKVFLNSATTIRYHSTPSKQREVFLNGEAFFEVKADKKNPFLVHLNDFTIKVTGTQFNARSYTRCSTEEATLIEGEIAILNNKGSEITKIKPNESVIFDKSTHKFAVNKVNTTSRTEWRSGKIYLKNKTIEEIAATLERWYDVRFEFENESIKQVRLTGTILKNKPIEQILEILKISEPVDFEYQYENQIISTIKIKHMQ